MDLVLIPNPSRLDIVAVAGCSRAMDKRHTSEQPVKIDGISSLSQTPSRPHLSPTPLRAPETPRISLDAGHASEELSEIDEMVTAPSAANTVIIFAWNAVSDSIHS